MFKEKKEVDRELLERLYRIINETAIVHYGRHKRKRGYSGNILLYVNHLVREMVIRVYPKDSNGQRRIIVAEPHRRL